MNKPKTKEDKKKKDSYRDTLHLPKTGFSMKANLLEIEPRLQKRWEKIDLYHKMLGKKHKKGRFLLHDGPPYANGPIHLGHLLNKSLKDFVVRSKLLLGYEVDFVPGWDCHGLPIEHKVLKELGPKAKELEPIQVRYKCQSYAEKYVKMQTKQLLRLGTIGHYDNPYLTMSPDYEAAVLEVFAELVRGGLVHRDLKPVHWSIENKTALAEAELEYYQRTDSSIYVLFEITDTSTLPAGLNAPSGEPVHLMIWTTTPWTLPANLAVAVSPVGQYRLYSLTKNGVEINVILVKELAEKVFSAAGIYDYKEIGSCRGDELAKSGTLYTHPFAGRTGRVVTADYVSFQDGTGLVHMAPGHGVEDYQTGLKENLPVYCPVLEDGTFDESVPEWLRGVGVWESNRLIIERIKNVGLLFHHKQHTHSYPHDWRSKTPTIFRATEQWFINVDTTVRGTGKTLRELALLFVEDGITFVPEWGRNRFRGMLESRPDWCISRQRAWGLPIPGFYNEKGQTLLTSKSVMAVAGKIRDHGANYWFKAEAGDILSEYDPTSDPDAPDWAKNLSSDEISKLNKGMDIFDVWFESGSSWNAVLKSRSLGYPADLYLEGSDQHRGWFQLSLLPALGATGQPPFNGLLTHGFMVDAEGRKMSKSGGNAIEVDDLINKYGADICRWWVSSLNYTNDIKVDWEFFKIASEEYRKVRNTLRFLLGNLNDFDPESNAVDFTEDDRCSLDAWALNETNILVEAVSIAYESYDYKKVNELIFNFCNNTLSAVYLAAVKDRLYCESTDSRKRRRTQTAMFFIADVLVKILAPIIVHTAEDAYSTLHMLDPQNTEMSVHLEDYPDPHDLEIGDRWDEVMALRESVLKALEEAKASQDVRNPLDAGIVAVMKADKVDVLSPYVKEGLDDLCGVSRFTLQAGDEEQIIVNDLKGEPRCDRSWKRDGTVKLRSDGGMLSDRDAEAVGVT